MSEPTKDKSWKTHLLKSGLPLEHVAAKALSNRKFHVWGEYTYNRLNEEGRETTFSVDLWANFRLRRKYDRNRQAELLSLIECKYTHPEATWVFNPHLGMAHPGNPIRVLDDFTSKVLENHEPIEKFTSKFPTCLKGSESPESNAIQKGGYQLRYALPVLTRTWFLGNYMYPFGANICFLCPILLTTAKLYVLKHSVNLTDFHSAKSLTAVARRTPVVVASQTPDESLEKFTNKQAGLLLAHDANIGSRLEQFNGLLNPAKKTSAYNQIKHRFEHINKSIFIVNFDYFGQFLDQLVSALSIAQASIKPYAEIERLPDGSIGIKAISKKKKR